MGVLEAFNVTNALASMGQNDAWRTRLDVLSALTDITATIAGTLNVVHEAKLPNERHRCWELMLGSAPMYEQAQYFWRVINDFMDSTRPIPEVPGLIHQVRSMEKLGWTLEDITHGGKEVPIDEWEEVEKELRRDAEALKERLRRLFTPDYFDAQTIYDFYQQSPVHFKRDALRTILIKFKQFNRAGMYPGFFGHYERENTIPRL